MHHQFANQELSRLSYAEAIRDSSRRIRVDELVAAQPSRTATLRLRVRDALATLFAHAPAPAPSVR